MLFVKNQKVNKFSTNMSHELGNLNPSNKLFSIKIIISTIIQTSTLSNLMICLKIVFNINVVRKGFIFDTHNLSQTT
jgi:hypothetical protein